MQNNLVFDFRIEKATNGAEIINTHLQTPWNALTPEMLIVYKEVENSLYMSERMKRRAERQYRRNRKIHSLITAYLHI